MPAPVPKVWSSPDSPPVLLDRMRGLTEPLDGGFTLMHRLSGAGVVVRTLRAPDTTRPFFGKVREADFSVAMVPHASDITPFHPIIRARVDDGPHGGSLLSAELAHHPNARTFAPLYAFGAVALGLGVLIAARDQPPLVGGGLALATLFAVFPTLQARMRFRQSVERSAEAFARTLGLETPS